MLRKSAVLVALTAKAALLSIVAFAATGANDADISDAPSGMPDPECYPDEPCEES